MSIIVLRPCTTKTTFTYKLANLRRKLWPAPYPGANMAQNSLHRSQRRGRSRLSWRHFWLCNCQWCNPSSLLERLRAPCENGDHEEIKGTRERPQGDGRLYCKFPSCWRGPRKTYHLKWDWAAAITRSKDKEADARVDRMRPIPPASSSPQTSNWPSIAE